MPAKIFIMDDDIELCDELVEVLTGEGYFVRAEHDGLKGNEELEKGIYDLLLLDLKLPRLSGFDIIKNLKDKKNNIKIIVISGRPKSISLLTEDTICKNIDKEEEEILKLADGIMSKPFNVKGMLEKIKEFLI